MGEVHGDSVNIAAAEESVQGTLATTGYLNLEADAVGDPGPQYKKGRRSPFTITRQLRRTFVQGLDCSLTLDVDVIKDHIDFFGEAMFKSEWQHSGGTGQSKFAISAVVDGAGGVDSFTVAADGDLAEGTLVVTRGLDDDENNALFRVAAGSTDTSVKVPTGSLVADVAPNANATLDVAGFQFLAGDLELDADGNLITTIKDLRNLGLYVGQEVRLPGSSEQDAPYIFDTADYYGAAEIVTIAQNKLTLRRRQWDPDAADDGAGKTIRLFYTKWIRNVARSHDDEKKVSHSFEITYPGLGVDESDQYEYLAGYMLNMATWKFPSEDKVTLQLTFIGKTAANPSPTRETGPSSALNCVTSLPITTSGDINRLSVENVDESGLMTDFATLDIVLNNGIIPVKAVGTMGNRFTPLGTFEATMTGDAFFTTPEIIAAVSDNRILRLGAGGRNNDFGVTLFMPATGAMKSDKKISKGQLVTISSEIAGFMDPQAAYTASMSVFAYLPTLAPGLET